MTQSCPKIFHYNLLTETIKYFNKVTKSIEEAPHFFANLSRCHNKINFRILATLFNQFTSHIKKPIGKINSNIYTKKFGVGVGKKEFVVVCATVIKTDWDLEI
ncbi:hypothetical protein BpHYR1_027392 [Brachionus plicatilis]|uniref:Uncharacterized protein n=1 Tax=Brachionus plicatilis TaxID=10195 RepID=A0A3M7P482_BRAPC|nr:hypothetical protein BpHYR1_027392 [Brachionus plicatilis]